MPLQFCLKEQDMGLEMPPPKKKTDPLAQVCMCVKAHEDPLQLLTTQPKYPTPRPQ